MSTDLRTRLMRLAKADPRVGMEVSKILKLSNGPDMGIYTRTLQYVAREMANLVSGEVVSVDATYGGGVAAVSIRNYMGQTGSKVLVILEDNTRVVLEDNTRVDGGVVLRFEHDDVFGKNIRLTEGDASAPSIQELLSSDVVSDAVQRAYKSIEPGLLLGNKIDAIKVFQEDAERIIPKRLSGALKMGNLFLDAKLWTSSKSPELNKAGNITFDVDIYVDGHQDGDAVPALAPQIMSIFIKSLENFKIGNAKFVVSKKMKKLSPTRILFTIVGIVSGK